jgi:hypothetical protein
VKDIDWAVVIVFHGCQSKRRCQAFVSVMSDEVLSGHGNFESSCGLHNIDD